MAERDLVVRFIGDDRQLQQAFNRTERRTKQFDSSTQRLAGGLTRAFAAVGIAVGVTEGLRLIKGSIQAASDLNEEMSKSKQVFGEASDEVLDWSQTTAQAFGISQTAALQATGTFGNLFRVVGITGNAASQMSRQLVELAADMASFNNASPEDVLLAIRSGLIGEAEPLRRFGVLLSEARVQQLALANTGKQSVRSLTNQEKALARYQIILRDTASAQGDFARTSGSLANQQRILQAEAANLGAQIGGVLVPFLKNATAGASDLARGLGAIKDIADRMASPIADVGSETEKSSGFMADFRENLARILTPGAQFAVTMNAAADALERLAGTDVDELFPGPHAPPRGPGGITGSGTPTIAEVEQAERAAGQATIDRIERQAAAQDDYNRQLADSEKRAAHLRDLIREDPTNANLQRRLSAELQRQQALRENIAGAAKRAADEDKRAADEAKRRAEEEKRRARERRQAATERRVAARNARQFRALGLTATGERRVPGIEALRRRGRNLTQQLRESGLDENQIRKFTRQISVIFGKGFNKAGRDVRQSILDMFAMIAGALEDGGKKLQGPLTKTSGLNTRRILEGMGLTAEQENELRGRLSSINTGGRQLAPGGGAGIPTVRPAGESGVQIDNFVTVEIDGRAITATVTKQQQKARRRNPRQKRGPNRSQGGV